MDETPGESSKATAAQSSIEAAKGRLKQRRVWIIVAALLVAAGAGSSIFAFSGVRASSERSQKAFASSSVQIATTLQVAIQHEQDLVLSTESFIIGNPHPTQTQFSTWANDLDVLQRYRELLGLVVIQYVPKSGLSAYLQETSDDQSTSSKVPPLGNRAFYCFVPIEVLRGSTAQIPPNFNLCTGKLGPAILAARNSGMSAVVPLQDGKTKTLAFEVPIYRSGSVPSTIAARETTFVELVGLSVKPNVLFQTALKGHPNTAVALRYGSGSAAVVLRSGQTPAGAATESINLHDGWTVETLGVENKGGLLGGAGGLPLLLGGIGLSLLLAALIYVLGSGRAHSRGLVDERTDELRYLAMHDPLTGLPNRALISDRIDQLLARNRRNGTIAAALYVDIDDFKNVNDSLGHQAGDLLLAAIATRMQSTLRGADTIGRMGGDEFVVLIEGSEPMVAPELVADRLLAVMQQPFELDGIATSLFANASIGIAVGDRATGGELLRDADIALYQAKARGKNRYEFFHPEMQTDIGRRIRLEFDLRSALAAEQFHLVYQPIYNLADLSVVGVEALLRWEHPTEGVLGPDEFIPILEHNGQIREVGAWVLRQACAQTAAWHARGYAIDISVNVSGRQLDDDRIIEHIHTALDESGLSATSLIIEVTETALMRDTSSVVGRLHSIKELGVSIAVDDFGTGYSSLAYLQQFPVDSLKIDKSFTSAISSSPESEALIRTFVQLGRDLGLTTLAEGVETTGEMDVLRADHVDEVQGFLFARPLEPGLLEAEFLKSMQTAGRAAPPAHT
jgi:diguanylate cyclase (GGDEF)-like protein